MSSGYRDYQSTSYNASSGVETDFTKLSQTVANNVQKISNNGMLKFVLLIQNSLDLTL